MVFKAAIKRLFSKKADAETQVDAAIVKGFRKRYARFRKLLDANAALADLMTDMEIKLGGTSLFGITYVRYVAKNALNFTRRMSSSLQGMHGGRYEGLTEVVDNLEKKIYETLGPEQDCREMCKLMVLPLSAVDLSMVDWVGGKAANLGEMQSMAQLPVPRGFAITVTAFQLFMTQNNLGENILKLLAGVDPEDRENLSSRLERVRELVENTPLPQEILTELDAAYVRDFGDADVRLAVRSSSQTEDGDKSFAGQFLSELGVARKDVPASYRRVIASLFTPSATVYRLHQGITLGESAMGVACVEMVQAVSSGVAYSHDPVNLLNETLVINATWGLGRYLVDGLVSPDMWIFTREERPSLVRRRVSSKERMLRLDGTGNLVEAEVSAEDQRRFCLTDAEAEELARMVMRVESHYGGYQDVEWAKDTEGKLVLLQSRPLDMRNGSGRTPKMPLLPQYPLLLEGGDAAYAGVGHGPIVMPTSPEDLVNFPKGGVLVARHSSATYAMVLDRAQAVVTETGGITGHMATICREFHVPTILNMPEAMRVLTPGQLVTVDAFSCRVYEGVATELLPMRMELDSVRLQGTSVYSSLRDVSQYILPLNLLDPNAASFAPSGCRTLHDVMRYAHELSYHEMFAISDEASEAGGVALKLKAPLPIDLHLIDLDKGTTASPTARSVKPEEITCVPLKALLSGMLRPDTMFRRPRPISMGGFMSVMGQQIVNPQGGDGRFGDKSYAIISDRYMNFSSRVGYHYSVLDAYCGNTLSKNYISFNFQGGAAGEERRIRRCRAIALVLEELGFTVNVRNDAVKSRFQKYEKSVMEDRLDQLGRLLQVTRQMDMLMINEQAVRQFKEDFMNGIYR